MTYREFFFIVLEVRFRWLEKHDSRGVCNMRKTARPGSGY